VDALVTAAAFQAVAERYDKRWLLLVVVTRHNTALYGAALYTVPPRVTWLATAYQ
jgi:hypothetical protein